MKRIFLILALVLISKGVFAEGYAVNLMGTKQNAMGHIGTGFSLGASDVFFNPGAIGLTNKKFQFEFGGSLVNSKANFHHSNGSDKETTDSPIGTPFYFYSTARINSKLTAGLGVYTPFGNSLKWGDDWSGKYLIQDISLRAIFIQPTLAYKFNDNVSFGAGFVYVDGNLDMNKGLPFPGASVNLKAKPKGYGYNLGLYVKGSEKFSFGITYRSEIVMDIDMEGDATFTGVPDAAKTLFPDTKFASELPLAASLNIGAAYKVIENLTLALDINYVFWDSYKSLDFDFKDNTKHPLNGAPMLADAVNAKEYENTMSFRFGAEYNVSDQLALRGGAYFDMTPIQDDLYSPETPGANKTGLSTGLTFKITEKIAVDASLLYLFGKSDDVSVPTSPTTTFGGDYDTQAWVPSFGLTITL